MRIRRVRCKHQYAPVGDSGVSASLQVGENDPPSGQQFTTQPATHAAVSLICHAPLTHPLPRSKKRQRRSSAAYATHCGRATRRWRLSPQVRSVYVCLCVPVSVYACHRASTSASCCGSVIRRVVWSPHLHSRIDRCQKNYDYRSFCSQGRSSSTF